MTDTWTLDHVKDMSSKLHGVIRSEDWQTNRESAKDLQKWLALLKTYKPDQNSLRESKIGVAVNKLRKHSDQCVSAYASMLTDKWKSALDMKPASNNVQQTRLENSTKDIENKQRNDAARQRLQQSYANEKAKRESRTSIFLDNPVSKTKGRKTSTGVTTITRFTNSSRTPMPQKPMRGIAPPSSSSTSKTARPVSSSSSSNVRPPQRDSLPPSNPSKRMTPEEERHHRRQMKYRMLAEQKLQQTGKSIPPLPSGSSNGKSSSSSSSSKPDSRKLPKTKEPLQPKLSREEQERKQFLDKMYPRVVGRAEEPKSKRKREDSAKPATTPLKEGERDVMLWLKGLTEDMSQYAQAFFDNGFDSMKIVATLTEKDIAAMIPKRGHCRVVEQALDGLKAKDRKKRIESKPKRKLKSYDDDEDDEFDSDDGFVVNDDEDQYVPGAITSMIRKKRGRPAYYEDDGDSSDMEATFDEIQQEEYRSARYGDYEDEKEDRLNRIHKERKKKRKER